MPHTDETKLWSTPDGVTLRAIQRPDGHWFVQLPREHPDAWPDLVAEASHDVGATLVASRPADQNPADEHALRRAGFLPVRTETLWRLPLSALQSLPVRSEHELIPVTELAPEDVAALDNTIRGAIPGTSGWQGTAEQLLESLDDDEFDPALYLVARHPRTQSLDGLIRVWNRRPEPRLGCVGVTPPWRRTRLAAALLHTVAATLRDRGVTHITAETDQTNRSSHRMAQHAGATELGHFIEWQRPVDPSAAE